MFSSTSQGAYGTNITSNNSHLKIITLPLYSNLHILPPEAARGHHCSPLPYVGILIPELSGTGETDITKRNIWDNGLMRIK